MRFRSQNLCLRKASFTKLNEHVYVKGLQECRPFFLSFHRQVRNHQFIVLQTRFDKVGIQLRYLLYTATGRITELPDYEKNKQTVFDDYHPRIDGHVVDGV